MRSNFSLRKHSFFLVMILYIIDCLIVPLFLCLLTISLNVPWSEYYSYLTIASLVLSFLFFQLVDLYRPWRGKYIYKEALVILKAWSLIIGAILSLFFLFKVSEEYSRSVIISWLCLTPLAIFIFHLAIRKTLNKLRELGKNLRFGVIVGAGELGQKLQRHIENIPWAGIKIIGFFDDEKTGADLLEGNPPVLGNIRQLPEFLKDNENVDYIYIALPMKAESIIIWILKECRTFGAKIFMIPDLLSFKIFNVSVESLDDIVLLNFNPDYRRKRYFDIVFSLLAILITLPIMFVIALLVKLQDGGPIFYGHERITTAGKKFNCWKFRTMIVGADKKLEELLRNDSSAEGEWKKTFKLKKDPRVTKIGKFLRKTSLDELPQLFNVLLGEMSIVGARPIVEKELYDYYKDNSGLYCSIKPGITGPWQIGKRSNTEEYQERVESDTRYMNNLSLWLDLKIILKTIGHIFKGKGAY